ncbi:MAG: tRNA lysidine(34) synthetase TilS [Erysipelotrichaceae bacterium]|nr:tRNA lysidine(34) synthetase TilS [Erysipelotrichaceae bacterium]
MTDLKNFKGRYLVAVSGGPDSMALLDVLWKAGNYLEAAHVNYHRRDTADRDEKLVRQYCEKHQIPFHLLNVYSNEVEGNFQAYARKARYSFFASLCKENDLEAVMVAHHKDDLIETYLMQKEKKLGVSHYGLAEDTVIEGARVIRPFLEMDKKALLKYCQENEIPYGIDESNLHNGYARNRIRHQIVDQMDDSEKEKIVEEIESQNRCLQEKQNIIEENARDHYDAEEFLALPYLIDHLRMIFPGHSLRYYEEMLKQLTETKLCVLRDDGTILAKEYGSVDIFAIPQDYEYVFQSPEDLKEREYEHFRLSFYGNSVEALTLSEEDFPITIRNAKAGDEILMRYGTKKINRFFIDRKIPLKERITWPVVLNRKDEVILLPGLGCDIYHYSQKPGIYVIKL